MCVCCLSVRKQEDVCGPTVAAQTEGFYRKPTMYDLSNQFKMALRNQRNDLAPAIDACEAKDAERKKQPKSAWSALATSSVDGDGGGGGSFSFNF